MRTGGDGPAQTVEPADIAISDAAVTATAPPAQRPADNAEAEAATKGLDSSGPDAAVTSTTTQERLPTDNAGADADTRQPEKEADLRDGQSDSAPVNPDTSAFTAVATGAYHACALRADQAISCWGYNSNGQTELPDGTYTAVTGGAHFSCALRTDRTIACWGHNNQGQTEPPGAAP